MSPESLAKARLEVIDGEGVEEVRGEPRSELTVKMTLWDETSLTDSASAWWLNAGFWRGAGLHEETLIGQR